MAAAILSPPLVFLHCFGGWAAAAAMPVFVPEAGSMPSRPSDETADEDETAH